MECYIQVIQPLSIFCKSIENIVFEPTSIKSNIFLKLLRITVKPMLSGHFKIAVSVLFKTGGH